MEEKWRVWHETVLLPLLEDRRTGKDLPPALKTLLGRDPATVDLALLSADTDRTQDYVFESTTLPEIRGASELLVWLNGRLRGVLASAGLPETCVLYCDGGGLLALVPASVCEGPDGLPGQVERLYPGETGVATITCVSQRVSPAEVVYGYGGQNLSYESLAVLRKQATQEDWQRIAAAYEVEDGGVIPPDRLQRVRGFGQMIQLMSVRLRARKDRPPARPALEALPFAVRCALCQVRPASQMYLYFDDLVPVCDPCRRKAPEGQPRNRDRSEQVRRFVGWLGEDEQQGLAKRYYVWDRPPQVHYAQDLNELGEACQARPGYVGLIHADGNHIGRILESLPTPQAYRQFSEALKDGLRSALYRALAENLRPVLIERKGPKDRSLGRGYIHPFEPLLAGGDDLVAIVPGDAALPVAVRLCQVFEREMARHLPSEWGSVTLSVGVTIAESHNPVRVLEQVSRELCKNAKRRGRAEKEEGRPATSTLDYLLIKSQSMLRRDVRQLRQMPPYYYSEGNDQAGRYLTASPFTLYEATCLLELLKRLRQLDFATSQLQGLVASLREGRDYGQVHYLYQLARLTTRLGPARKDQNLLAMLPEIWPFDGKPGAAPWRRVPGQDSDRQVASVLPDLLELYPFVPRYSGLGPETRRSALADLWQEILMEAPHAG